MILRDRLSTGTQDYLTDPQGKEVQGAPPGTRTINCDDNEFIIDFCVSEGLLILMPAGL